MTDMTLLSIESNFDRYTQRGEEGGSVTLAKGNSVTIGSDVSGRHNFRATQCYVTLQRLPKWLNAQLTNYPNIPRHEMCHRGELGKLLERNEEEYTHVLGKALQVAADHPVLRLKLPALPLDTKHTVAHLIGELIVTNKLEGFEDMYE